MTELGNNLLQNIADDFNKRIRTDKKLKQIANRVRDGTDYEDANAFAIRAGELLSEAMTGQTDGLAYISEEVAQEAIAPMLGYLHELVAETTTTIQTNMNAANDLGIGVATPALDQSRINGIVEKLASYETLEQGQWMLKEPVINYSQAIVDQSIRDNAAQAGKMGLKAYIERKTEPHAVKTTIKTVRSKKGKVYKYPYKYSEPCPWCLSLAGVYEYIGNGSNIPRDVYRRHEACRCTLTFKNGKQRQNVWNHSETWTEEDAQAQIQTVKNAQPVQKPIPNNSIAQSIGDANYRLMDNHVQAVGENNRKVWEKYEDKIHVSSTGKKRGVAYGNSINFNLKTELNPVRADHKEFQVFFHESHHAIDHLAGREFNPGMPLHFSAAYKDHIFPETIVNEVQDLVKERAANVKQWIAEGNVDMLRASGAISEWDFRYRYGGDISKVKYSKSMAYSALQHEVRQLPDVYRGDLSDILEGATNGQIMCGYGHGKGYWRDRTFRGVRDGLATEAFAEMSDSTFSNPESLEAIQKYLPKSYAVYTEMIEYLATH